MLASDIPHLSLFASEPSVGKTLRAARRAQTRWSRLPLRQRLDRVRAFRNLLAEQAEEFARTAELPERSSVAETLVAEILPLAEACRFLERNAESVLATKQFGRLRGLLPGGLSGRIERSPWGLVLVICAGNYPIFLPGVQAVQALTAGNAVVLKPAPGTERVVNALCELLLTAGFDRELLVVLDESPESAQKVISSGVDKVLFTGSSWTGRAVLDSLTQTITPATLELSGSDAVFVHPEADLDQVVAALEFGLTFNSSATCIAPRRVFVPRALARQFEDRIEQLLAAAEPITLTADRARELQRLVYDALRRGARLVGDDVDVGVTSTPVILSDVTPEMEVAGADLFAPLLSVFVVDEFEEALDLDDRCPYSLGASVFAPPGQARIWAERIRAGVVVINDLIAPTADPRVPFGGWDESGYGVTRGAEGLLELTRPKTLLRRHGSWRPHYQKLQAGDDRLFSTLIQAKHAQTWRRRLRGWFSLGEIARSRSRRAGR